MLGKSLFPYDPDIIGELLGVIFNSPFALNAGKGKLCFNNLSAIACTSFVGIAMGFISWIIDNVKGKNKAILLFSSRDCYFLYKLYTEIMKNEGVSLLPKAEYIYISRQALRGVEITSYDELLPFFMHAKYAYGKTKLKDFLRLIFETDFNITYDGVMCELSDADYDELIRNEIFPHSKEIIAISKEKRDNYLRYFKRIDISKYEEIYLVDVQTTGSSLFSLSKLIDKKIKLMTIRLIYNDNNVGFNDKCVFVKEISSISSFANKCMILEKAYASNGGQLIKFDKDGYPLFCAETKYNEKMLKELQRAMKKFINSYLDTTWYKRKISVNLIANLLDCIDSSCSIMNDDIVAKFSSRDYLASDVNMNEMKIIRGALI